MPEQIKIVENILKVNDSLAEQNLDLLNQFGVFAIDLIASPGAGKTTLVEKTVSALSNKMNIAVINGDIATQLDTDRAAAAGALAKQINTGGECHLDANMVKHSLDDIDLEQVDLLISENVGNLICPTNFKLGSHKTVIVASIPEGSDKPYKYPGTYIGAGLVILNKIDLLPYVPFDLDYFSNGIKVLNPDVEIIQLSCLHGEGFDQWLEWLLVHIPPK